MPQDLWPYQSLFQTYLSKSPSPLASYSFVNIFVWQDFFRFDFEVIDQHLCVFASDPSGTFLYLPPLGENLNPQVVDASFEQMTRRNQSPGIARIENIAPQQIPIFDSQRYDVYLKGHELVYYRTDLTNLKGGNYKSKRNAIHGFVKAYQAQYVPFERSMIEECLALYDRWAKDKLRVERSEAFRYMLADNRLVHQKAMEHFASLGLVGRIIQIDQKIVAYTFGYYVTETMFCDLFEIADVAIKGLPTYLFYQLCCDSALQRAQFINVMDDFEMEQVTKTKMSYYPRLLLASSIVRKRV